MASWLIVSVLGILLSALGLAVLKLENSKNGGEVVEYESRGWLRECAVWDEEHNRFLVSNMEGGIGEISLLHRGFLKEETVVRDLEYLGNSTLGLRIDPLRQRVVVAIADPFGHKYSALAAYDLNSWNRLYLTKLTGPESISLADDVDLDPEGNAYVTDAKQNVIWKGQFGWKGCDCSECEQPRGYGRWSGSSFSRETCGCRNSIGSPVREQGWMEECSTDPQICWTHASSLHRCYNQR